MGAQHKAAEPGFGPRAAASSTAQALPKEPAARTSGRTAVEQLGGREVAAAGRTLSLGTLTAQPRVWPDSKPVPVELN